MHLYDVNALSCGTKGICSISVCFSVFSQIFHFKNHNIFLKCQTSCRLILCHLFWGRYGNTFLNLSLSDSLKIKFLWTRDFGDVHLLEIWKSRDSVIFTCYTLIFWHFLFMECRWEWVPVIQNLETAWNPGIALLKIEARPNHCL